MLRKPVAILLLALACALPARAQKLDEDLIAAARKGNVEAVKDLLAKGANVNAKTRYGATPLSYAADRGNVEIVRMLLERGADVNVQDTFYRATPMTWAASKGFAEIVKLLLDKGAGGKDQALMIGAGDGHVDMVKVVLEKGGVLPETLTMALARAEKNNHKEIVDLLKGAGAKPAPKADFQVDAETLQSYVGVYKNAQVGDFVMSLKDGKLYARLGNQPAVTMAAYDKSTFTILEVDGVMIKFIVEGNKVTGLNLKQSGASMDFKRVEQQ